MSPLSPDGLIQQLKWRYATKRFDPARSIPEDKWKALEESLVLSPSSFGLQPWRFIVVSDPATRKALVPVSWGQTQPADCSKYVVFAALNRVTEDTIDHYVRRMASVRGVTPESLAAYRGMMTGTILNPSFDVINWTRRQAYIALGNFMTSAAMLDVDTCPMEGIDPAKYDEILGLAGGDFRTVVACAAGFRAGDDKNALLAKVRFPAEEMIVRK